MKFSNNERIVTRKTAKSVIAKHYTGKGLEILRRVYLKSALEVLNR